MSSYAIFFDYNNETYRLPVNPEQMEVSSTQSIETYKILNAGQIAIPSGMELKKFKFETELPIRPQHYIVTPNRFLGADAYLNLFETWRSEKEAIRLIATNGISEDINTLVLIEDITITEKAGEEGDKYVSFSLLEYNPFDMVSVFLVNEKPNKSASKTKKTVSKKKNRTETKYPKNNGYYVVQKNDTLWAIAKKYYGEGAAYTKLYHANKDKIKNPNLIYVGQKLTIPS
ncbi:MAG: LysM peptidoglycan-binding domain-containing protein [Velocimicrobium sp.]